MQLHASNTIPAVRYLIKSASDRAVWVQPTRAGPQMVGEAGQNDKVHCKGTERKTQSMDMHGLNLDMFKV